MSNQSNALVLPERGKEMGIAPEAWATMNQLYAGANPDSIMLVYQYCKARKLDPLRKPVHIVPMYVRDHTGKGAMRDVIMPGIQELRTTAARTKELAGQGEPEFGPVEEVHVFGNAVEGGENYDKTINVPEWCRVTVYRMVATTNDPAGPKEARPFTAIEFFDECVARTKDGVINSMWQRRSRGQLAKCAAAAAIRSAFPEETGGVMSAEEMIGKDITNDAIDGDFTVVGEAAADDIPDPVDLGPVAREEGAAPAKRNEATDKPKEAERAEAQRTGKPAATEKKPPAETKPAGDLKITLQTGQYGVLTKMLERKNITEQQLLAGFGKDVTIDTLNDAFTWIREQ